MCVSQVACTAWIYHTSSPAQLSVLIWRSFVCLWALLSTLNGREAPPAPQTAASPSLLVSLSISSASAGRHHTTITLTRKHKTSDCSHRCAHSPTGLTWSVASLGAGHYILCLGDGDSHEGGNLLLSSPAGWTSPCSFLRPVWGPLLWGLCRECGRSLRKSRCDSCISVSFKGKLPSLLPAHSDASLR